MADRFERLFELPSNLYSAKSPVIVSAGALLKDTQTGNIVVQLKYQSVSSSTIKALCVDIAAYDVSGNEIQGKKNYQYLDLAIKSGQAFGSNKAIVMPDVTTRSFAINSLSVVLSDGSTISVLLPLEKLPESLSLQQGLGSSEFVKQYRIETNKNASYVPSEAMGLWKCACGEWNGYHVCTNCHLTKNAAFNSCNLDHLSVLVKERLEAEDNAKRQKAQHEAEKETQKKAQKKKITVALSVIALAVAISCMFALWIYPDLIKPSMMYDEAQQLLSEAKYDDAAMAFDALGDYKDAESMAKEAIYQKGCATLNNQKFDEAINIFHSLGNYSDSVEKETEAYYKKALVLKDSGDIEEAIAIFAALSGYQNSDAECVELQYALANDYLNAQKYDEAKSIFESISFYADSEDLVKECDYQKGCRYFDNSQYLEAIAVFEGIAGYLDAETRIAAAYSLYYLEEGSTLYNEAKFYLAIDALKKSDEAAARDLIDKAESEIEYINSVCGEYRLVEEYWYGDKVTIGPANRDSCVVSFDFEDGRFVFDNNKYVADHSFAYNFDRNGKLHYNNHYQGGKDYDYQFVNGRLLWDEGNGTYEYYAKR